jgi:hypothetical protein
LRGASYAADFADRRRRIIITALGVLARIGRIIAIEGLRAFFLSVYIDVLAKRSEVSAVVSIDAIAMDPNAKARDGCAAANVVLRAVGIAISGITGKPAIDACVVGFVGFARETGRTVVAVVATGRQLHAALALDWNLETLAPVIARLVWPTSATAGEYALLDRRALQIIATRLDAHGTNGAIVCAVARAICRTGSAQRAGRARNGGATRARHAARARLTRRSTSAPRATRPVKGRATASVIPATNGARRNQQPYSKPSISHQGLLNNKFTEIFRCGKSPSFPKEAITPSCAISHSRGQAPPPKLPSFQHLAAPTAHFVRESETWTKRLSPVKANFASQMSRPSPSPSAPGAAS